MVTDQRGIICGYFAQMFTFLVVRLKIEITKIMTGQYGGTWCAELKEDKEVKT